MYFLRMLSIAIVLMCLSIASYSEWSGDLTISQNYLEGVNDTLKIALKLNEQIAEVPTSTECSNTNWANIRPTFVGSESFKLFSSVVLIAFTANKKIRLRFADNDLCDASRLKVDGISIVD